VSVDPASPEIAAEPPATPVWLYPGKTAFGVVPAILTLEHDRVRVRTSEPVSERTAQNVAKLAEQPLLIQQLQSNSEVTILDVPLSSVEASFSKAAFGSVLYLRVADRKWKLALYPPQPQGVGIGAIVTLPILLSAMAKGRRAGRAWREALAA